MKPSIEEITNEIRALQTRDTAEAEALLIAGQKRLDSHKYNVVEIGWQLMRLKESVEHGNVGNQHAAKNKIAPPQICFADGFTVGVEREFGLDGPRASRFMNAARNAGLTAESAPEEMAEIRSTKALTGKLLKDLYAPPGGKESLSPHEIARQQMEMAQAVLFANKNALFRRIRSEVLEQGLVGLTTPDEIEDAYHTLREATAKVGEMRKVKRSKAA